MTIFETKKTLSHPDVGSNPSDQPFWWDVFDAIEGNKYTHIKDGNGILYKIDEHKKLKKEVR